MNNGDYFFVVFLGAILLTRLFLIKENASPSVKNFRLHHYMYGVVLVGISLLIKNLTMCAIGFGLFIDELPIILTKGPGHREYGWKDGHEYYHSSWCSLGLLALVFLIFIFRDLISSLI